MLVGEPLNRLKDSEYVEDNSQGNSNEIVSDGCEMSLMNRYKEEMAIA